MRLLNTKPPRRTSAQEKQEQTLFRLRYEEAKEKSASLKEEIIELEREKESLLVAVRPLRDEVAKLDGEIAVKRPELERLLAESHAHAVQNHQEEKSMRENLRSLRSEMDTARIEYASVEETMHKMQELKDRLQSEISETLKQVDVARREIAELTDKSIFLHKSLDERESSVSIREKEVAMREREIRDRADFNDHNSKRLDEWQNGLEKFFGRKYPVRLIVNRFRIKE